MRIVIVGAGGHGHVVCDIVACMSAENERIRLLGVLDDDPARHGHFLLGIKVLGPVAALHVVPHDAVIVAVGDNRARARLFMEFDGHSETFLQAVHPTAVTAADVVLGRGVMIGAGVVVNPAATVGDNVILNTACSVDHHCEVGAHAHIAPGVRLGGHVRIGTGALIGIGAVVLPGITVGDWAVVGGGAAVTRDVPSGTAVVGVPARALKRDE